MSDGPQVVNTEDYPETYTKHNDQSKAMYYYDRDAVSGSKEDSFPEVVPAQRRTILGLRRRKFWILVGIAAVVLAAAIGGSVGGSLAVRNSGSDTAAPAASSSPPPASACSPITLSATPSTSPSLTNYAVLPLSQVLSINVTCPSRDLTSLTNGDPNIAADSFRYTCTNSAAFSGPSSDIFFFTAYSLQQCIDACSQHNYMKPQVRCDAVVIEGNLNEGDLGRWKRGNGANCWLKRNASDSEFTGVSGSTAVRLVE